MDHIRIIGAKEGNLKNITVDLPRNKWIVLTGVSGSGKTTLAMDVLYQECQRQYLEAIGYQGIRKPDIEAIRHVSPAIQIKQHVSNKNPRSTVGTVTDIYTDLRMLFEKLSTRDCPACGKKISSADCREETEKTTDDFKVFQYCPHCDQRMEKLTRTHFSYNTQEGACAACQGMGEVLTIDEKRVLHEELALEEGAVVFWEKRYRDYQLESFYAACDHYGISLKTNTPVKDFTPAQHVLLLQGAESEEVHRLFPDVPVPRTLVEGRYEGVLLNLWRRMADKKGTSKLREAYFESAVCPECHGERLNELSRSVTVKGTRLPELSGSSLTGLMDWVSNLEERLKQTEQLLAGVYVADLKTKLKRILKLGLDYLSLDRQTMTLSGGETQRLRLAAVLDSDLTGVIYILDEPTISLHPKDTAGLLTVLRSLRDKGNTVLVIEHDTVVMEEADYLVDIGPGAGKYGGGVIGTGTLQQLKGQATSVTGAYLNSKPEAREFFRKGSGDFIEVRQADKHNLQNLTVRFPIGCLICVTGVSGSGKSTLVFDVLAKGDTAPSEDPNRVSGTGSFDRIVVVEQGPLTRMKRSNVATYSDAYTEIRKIFSRQQTAIEKGMTANHFSFNVKGGRCDHCEGLGVVTNNLLFFEDQEVPCPVCSGRRFKDDVLSVTYRGHSITAVVALSVEEGAELFADSPKISGILNLLQDVGLGYLELGQTTTTLSGGEAQRLKLAVELLANQGKKNLYLIDEPTTGLHPLDVEKFLKLLDRMVDSGSTVVVVEHNQQIIGAADWIIDLGPGGGTAGGKVIAEGTPSDIRKNPNSVTGKFI
ncbi:ATP-binding cassette domain-containing protein [Trichococcus pasteurii]|uniref:UvrABC system protein A n=1 Tax=Trichococcus pasteurii TaxID=43064 RepID=A0A1W1IEH6_9LACT|nr:excinuclease ABC subunit UvrA [Trichococcus pasteurii]SFE06102.1 excinuclease ABC subunit A [Trichococcus pasteurii]SLM51163.1 abc transporter [Trichococcus pasteurii]SSB92044.1 abc transporter [Trichococcus pasteurii]